MRDFLRDLYQSHRQGLFSLALAITGCRQQAEDAVQEAFAGMVDRQPPKGDPVPYLFQAVRHAAIDIQRGRRRDQRISTSLFNGYNPPRQQTDPQINMLTKERDQIIRSAIEKLPDD